DREMGERLFNMGIKSKQIRYSAICIHLDHARGYVKPEMIAKNKAIRKYTKENKVLRTPFGIEKD
ncbi:MAG TPA: glycosyl transferase family 2, partial [Glaciecola sp.]|nr:glycosyl transferase family 2 [Glaciecola sp.]